MFTWGFIYLILRPDDFLPYNIYILVHFNRTYLCDLYTGKPHWYIVSYLWKPVSQHCSQHSGKCVFTAYIYNCIVIQGQGVFRLRPVKVIAIICFFSTSCFITQLLFGTVSNRVGLKRCNRQTHIMTGVFSFRNKVMWHWREIKTRGNTTTLRPGGLAWCWWFWGRAPCLCLTHLLRSLS